MDDELKLLAAARVGELATIRPDGRPHLVPMVFAVVHASIVTAIDWKPKQGRRLQRLANIDANPAVSFLAHHFSEDWEELWWVRVDGRASIHESGERRDAAIRSLCDKYEQYRARPPDGEVIWVDPEKVSSWVGSQ